MRIIFLGTSGSAPTKARNLPSVAIEHEGEVILFDCGEGTQRQIMQFSVNISKVSSIFITHAHGDHIIGVAGLVRTLALNKRTAPLRIYIPEGQEKAIRSLLEFDNALIGYPIQIIPIKGGIVYKGDDYAVSAFKVDHTLKCYGFLFAEKDKQHFIMQKSNALGIKGKMFSELTKKGQITINGKKIALASVTTKESGRKIAYVTDTKPSKVAQKAVAGANVLIHEATYTEKFKEQAWERGHATAMQVAKIAKAAKVNMLVLTHISARYKDPSELLDEAKSVFKNTKVAQDGMAIEL